MFFYVFRLKKSNRHVYYKCILFEKESILMKRLLTVLVLILLAAGFSFESFAVDTFDVSDAGAFAMDTNVSEANSDTTGDIVSLFLFSRSVKSAATAFLNRELGINTVHGQPLPGVLITLLLGAAFGLARKMRGSRNPSMNENNAADTFQLTVRLLRMHILYLNPPETIHAISPGPDLFCQRE